MELNALTALSPVDGRYRRHIVDLVPHMSEYGLIRARLEVLIEYLITFSEHRDTPLRAFTPTEYKMLNEFKKVSVENAAIINKIETQGYKDIKATNHDVVAAIKYLRMVLQGTSLGDIVEWVHFGRTSEDVNNLAYALMLRRAASVLLAEVIAVRDALRSFALQYAALPMLGRTHGQPATPTTLGKEFNVFAERLTKHIFKLRQFELLVKCNGASGNYSADVKALPKVEWISFTYDFVLRLNKISAEERLLPFVVNEVTTQIEPHDTYAEFFGIFMRINTILIGLSQDVWRYISDDWLMQKTVEGEVGSSAMPQKVNPIDDENAEGNLGLSNAMLEFFCRKLPISRLQRDLSDSTVERAFGMALGHSLIGYKALLKGLGKISADQAKIITELENRPEVLAEAIQTILRREGVSGGYDLLKEETRGKPVSLASLHKRIDSLDIPEAVKEELRALKPSNFTGLAVALAARFTD
ncbi:adenylosuccinate lyase [Candidatus Adlerbacteria bacterium RIFCSPHIGHO2_12_FULL_53_18]|uniref:Adenylosuccinate lyase n=1 Tax=Candidatus Adlerbacteria bacterium RIFCSPHIGHO2_12_FULL_53_18 TaxID=1797242 RepID=A0A1F4XSQ7_9BACT|nr:MAG: adenylosuccinate lyase [Candidatus Adlerbacteria bacterium RIFCSPHIGHO2_12_FULL_53_18]